LRWRAAARTAARSRRARRRACQRAFPRYGVTAATVRGATLVVDIAAAVTAAGCERGRRNREERAEQQAPTP
jgi:hypothetical protein